MDNFSSVLVNYAAILKYCNLCIETGCDFKPDQILEVIDNNLFILLMTCMHVHMRWQCTCGHEYNWYKTEPTILQ